jgi:hypothetical protein
MMQYGRAVLDVLLRTGELEDHSHHIVILDGDCA